MTWVLVMVLVAAPGERVSFTPHATREACIEVMRDLNAIPPPGVPFRTLAACVRSDELPLR